MQRRLCRAGLMRGDEAPWCKCVCVVALVHSLALHYMWLILSLENRSIVCVRHLGHVIATFWGMVLLVSSGR